MGSTKKIELDREQQETLRKILITRAYKKLKKILSKKSWSDLQESLETYKLVEKWIGGEIDANSLKLYPVRIISWGLFGIERSLLLACYSDEFEWLCRDAMSELEVLQASQGTSVKSQQEIVEDVFNAKIKGKLLAKRFCQEYVLENFDKESPIQSVRKIMMNKKRIPFLLTSLQEMIKSLEKEEERLIVQCYISQHKRSWKRK